jgi:hypothetical protein
MGSRSEAIISRMIEGWDDERYLILFDNNEIPDWTRRYELETYLPGYEVVGLLSWDDVLVRSSGGEQFTVPTVPLDTRYLAPLTINVDAKRLRPDPHLSGKIKWYVKPIVFGGDPASEENIAWITLAQHVDAVKYFNRLFRSLRDGNEP